MIGLWTLKSFEGKDIMRVIKTIVFFEKIGKSAKCYCPAGFYSAN